MTTSGFDSRACDQVESKVNKPSTLKICGKCLQKKRTKEFSWKNKLAGTRMSSCKVCRRTYTNSHYVNNRQAYLDRNTRHDQRISAFIHSLKSGKPCLDCLIEYKPCVMQFDHRDPSTKVAEISNMVRNSVPMAVLEAEIAKCDLVCANCHFARTCRMFHKKCS